MARQLGAGIAALMLAACSLGMSSAGSIRKGSAPDCTTSKAQPRLDMALAVVGGLVGIGGLLVGAAGGLDENGRRDSTPPRVVAAVGGAVLLGGLLATSYGYSSAAACQEARAVKPTR